MSLEESDAIIEAAARGRVVPDHAPLGELLTSLHAPGVAAGQVPSIATSRGVAGRMARRTAVAASAAVLGLAGVAAAATGTVGLFAEDPPPAVVDENLGDAIVEESVPVVVAPDEGESDDSEAAPGGDGDDESSAAEAETESDVSHGHPEIEGVDASDGLDDEELAIACEGARNHGHYVSLVARDKITETAGTHGDRVSEAAKSDCGKDDDSGIDETGSDESDSDESDSDESDSDESDSDESDSDESDSDESDSDESDSDESDADGPGNGKGNGHEKAKGKGHSKGQGRGHDRD